MIEFSFYAAISVCIAGLVIRLHQFKREGAFLNPVKARTPRLTVKGFLLNTWFQAKLFKAGKIRWAIHFSLFISFLYLLFVHGLHAVTAGYFFSYYQPTLDPFQFLRNLSGFLVLAACLAFIIRRRLNLRINRDKKIGIKGLSTIIGLLLLIVSGFLLEASKIVSEPIFMEMVEEYSDIDEDELTDLKLYWKENYTVFFSERLDATPERLENGQVLNEAYCLYCHSPIRSAVFSGAVAKAVSGAGRWMNRNRADKWLYRIHYGMCLVLLVCLPFSRLSHILFIPFAAGRRNITLQGCQDGGVSFGPAMLSACTNCGYCSEVCSVYPNYQICWNPDILPHAKIESVKKILKDPASVDRQQLHAGHHACTFCHRCTDVCPSGIDLQGLWMVLDKKLDEMGVIPGSRLIGEMPLNEWADIPAVPGPGRTPAGGVSGGPASPLTHRAESFENCIQCAVCSAFCPVVDYDSNEIDMAPHQVMSLLRLNKTHLAAGTRMVWACLTCYACQENCPQEIRVTDILLALRNAGSATAEMVQKNGVPIKGGDR